MPSYLQVKEQALAETPLLLFDCTLINGAVYRWSTHTVRISGEVYHARVLQHNVFELQAANEQGVDGIPKINFDLANADSLLSEIERQTGWKGSRLSIQFLFFDLRNNQAASDAVTLFKGIVNAPDSITESRLRLSAVNRLSLQRLVLPPVRIQRRCPWTFPSTAAQRTEAVDGGTEGSYSRFYKCGYSPDMAGGVGNLLGSTPYTDCHYTRADCTARGMFSTDSGGRPTARFGGEEYVPSSIQVRSAGESGFHISPLTNNESRYNDFVPLIYGTAFVEPSIVFARNDGNLTRMEVILGMGPLQGVVKVVVNGIEIPQGISGQNMTGTGWFNVIGTGSRQGSFNPNFADQAGRALGDPYGSIAYLAIVIPNRINDGRSTPSVQVLVQGLQIPVFDSTGTTQTQQFSNNPAWVILDLLRRSGWTLAEFDLLSFSDAAAFCDQPVTAQDLNGNTIQLPRFACNLVLKTRRSAGDVIRGIRNAARLFLTFGYNGLLQLKPERSIAEQQPVRREGSNATSQLSGGFAAYEFGDGSNGFGGILRNSDGSSSVRLSSRGAADTPNRFTVEFQDALNDYQQDSYALVDVDDVAVMGQEITQTINALGLPNYNQAARVLQLFLNKSLAGNTQIEFDTSVKGLGLAPGDIISVTYAKEGLNRQLFRIQKIAVNTNYRSCRITAQWHDDSWYSDSVTLSSDLTARRHGGFTLSSPRPIGGKTLLDDGSYALAVQESFAQTADGTAQLSATVSFESPKLLGPGSPGIPLVSLAPQVNALGGTLRGPILYYGVTCSNADGAESALSFVISTNLLTGSSNAVTLNHISFPAEASTYSVYRGPTPSQLFQIAAGMPLSSTFTDPGLAPGAGLPPDGSYDHAAFYWRMELQPEVSVTIYSASTIGNSILQMPTNRYAGKVVRITRGAGAGQELVILENTANIVSCSGTWTILPDVTSRFTISEPSFTLGTKARFSPARFVIPNEAGAVVQISGRSVNANDVECPYELSPLTRWTIGGAGPQIVDQAVASAPTFALDAPQNPGGTLLLGGLSFPSLDNTQTISGATLTLYYVDETLPGSSLSLAQSVVSADQFITVSSPVNSLAPFIQIGTEVLSVVQILTGGTTIQVTRGMLGTTAAPLPEGSGVVSLSTKSVLIPFVRGFFGSPASGNWSFPISLPNVRVACASLTVTNSHGASDAAVVAFTNQVHGGIRSLSGGQYSFQIAGYLAIQGNAAPEIVIDAPRVVRDVFAVLGGGPVGGAVTLNVTLNGAPYCSLIIPDGATGPNAALDGFGLPAMKASDRLGLDVTSVGTTLPGNDLTVILRV